MLARCDNHLDQARWFLVDFPVDCRVTLLINRSVAIHRLPLLFTSSSMAATLATLAMANMPAKRNEATMVKNEASDEWESTKTRSDGEN